MHSITAYVWNIVPFTGNRSYYRSNSHAGLPKGAYIDPNPVHFHIASPCTQIQIKKSSPKRKPSKQRRDYVYSARSFQFSDFNTRITITLNDRNKTTVNLPLGVVRDFIYPFASLLNIAHMPMLGDAASQTSYLSRKDGEEDISYDNDLSDFEYDILRRLRSNLAELSNSESESNSEYEMMEQSIKQDNNNNITEQQTPENNAISFSTVDEGFDDTTNGFNNKSESLAVFEPSEVVLKMSDEIFQYLIRECYEIKELVLFPELIYNENVQKLMNKLKILYEEHCLSNMTEEEKNELRIQIAAVLMQVHLNEVNSCSPDSSFLSDKAFSTSEFVSDILDKFFSFIAEENITSFTHSLTHNELSSTPKSNYYAHEVTSFKKSVAEKSGNETFWIAISKSATPLPKSPTLPRKILNFDEIPVKGAKPLSPIIEEVRRKLKFIDEINSDDESFSCLDDVLAGGDTENTYVRFERPDNDIVSETTQFHRTNTVSTASYVNKSIVEFERAENAQNTDDYDGDWMGYEGAKF